MDQSRLHQEEHVALWVGFQLRCSQQRNFGGSVILQLVSLLHILTDSVGMSSSLEWFGDSASRVLIQDLLTCRISSFACKALHAES